MQVTAFKDGVMQRHKMKKDILVDEFCFAFMTFLELLMRNGERWMIEGMLTLYFDILSRDCEQELIIKYSFSFVSFSKL